MITPHQEYLALGGTEKARLLIYRSLFKSCMQQKDIAEINESINKEWILGCDRFKKKIEKPLAENDCSMVAIESQRLIRIKYSAPLIALLLYTRDGERAAISSLVNRTRHEFCEE